MAIFGRSRKGKGFDGSVPGISYNKFRSSLTPPLGSANVIGYHHDLYMHGNPREYRPNINAPSIDWNDYETYEPLNANHSLHKGTEVQFHAREINPGNFDLAIPQDELTITERLLQAMGKRNAEKCISNTVSEMGNNNSVGFVNSDDTPNVVNLVSAITQLSKVFPQDHPDIINLRKAFSEMINAPFETLAGDINPSRLGRGNPYETFEQPKEENWRGLYEDSQAVNDSPIVINEAVPEPFAENQMLDGIVQDFSIVPQTLETDMISPPEASIRLNKPHEMVVEEISNAINQAMQQPEDPFLAAQQIFNKQMQFMNNPFMMSGPM
jgi:hypothetical protein